MKAGDLIRYRTVAGESFIGIIVKDPNYHREYKNFAVEVYWQDDGSYTYEHMNNIRNPKHNYLELISESR